MDNHDLQYLVLIAHLSILLTIFTQYSVKYLSDNDEFGGEHSSHTEMCTNHRLVCKSNLRQLVRYFLESQGLYG